MTLSVAVYGAAGRMGRYIVDVVLQDDKAKVSGAIETSSFSQLGQDIGLIAGCGVETGTKVTDSLEEGLSSSDVVIDFTIPSATKLLVEVSQKTRTPAVIGTTGLDDKTKNAIQALSEVAPVIMAPNFSVGINALWHLASSAVGLLGSDFDMEIVEMHHRNKVDAPSGTAVRLAEAVAKARGVDLNQVAKHGRSGEVGIRTPDEIGVLALRGGDVVGEHTLVLAGLGERLELTHRAHTRRIFAAGAVRAAHWVVEQKPGLYDMVDVLGLPR